jgi:succinate dehydrogenase/fumarate reductase flavoprotein subunit
VSAPAGNGWDEAWDRVADVVVVGTGVAGFAAALAAADTGASVVLLERRDLIGGTTAKSEGGMWIPNNPLMRDAGLVDERDAALRYLARVGYPTRYNPEHPTLGIPENKFRLLEAFYDRGPDVVEHLTALGAIDVELARLPDYFAALDEDAAPVGRLLSPKHPPGWSGDPTGGQLVVDRMHEVAVGLGVDILLGRRAVHVIRDADGAVLGVEARVGRRTELIGGRRGVVFCSGGFLHNPELTSDYLRGPVLGGAAASGSTGDFVDIGIEVGARLGNMSHAWWAEVVVDLVAHAGETIHDVYVPFGDSMILVNRYGRRVVNEKIPYNERTQVHFDWDPVRGEYTNYVLFMIWDDAVAHDPTPSYLRPPVPFPGEHYDYVITADNWKDLAAAIEARLSKLRAVTGGFTLDRGFAYGLAQTVARFNELARAGVDTDFHRGETPLEKAWGAPARSGLPSGAMHPFLDQGPYYAVLLGPGALDTKGGPVIDELGQVLRFDGAPVPGLYGAGNCVASPAGQAYWGPGGTIGPALVFGHIAGTSAASSAPREPQPGRSDAGAGTGR